MTSTALEGVSVPTNPGSFAEIGCTGRGLGTHTSLPRVHNHQPVTLPMSLCPLTASLALLVAICAICAFCRWV